MKILLVGPIGDTPTEPMSDVAERLRGQGHEVGIDLPSYPDPYNPRTRADASLLSFLVNRLRAFLRWRKQIRPDLAYYDVIVVWDPMVAVMVRLARPRSARAVWSRTEGVIDDAWNALLIRLAAGLSDRVIERSDWYEEVAR